MSRCFPFPPPGYEKRPKSDHVDLLAKEKHRERKHKKEKGREKTEGREKDKDCSSKDRHKNKKERKEKHKEKKRDKDNDKDKARTLAERSESLTEFNHEGRIRDGSQKAVEAQDSTRFMDELGWRIKDEKEVATRMVNNIDHSPQSNSIRSDQRKNDRPEKNISNKFHSVQRLSGRAACEPAIQKGKVPTLGNLAGTGQSQNGGTSQPLEKLVANTQRRSEGCPHTINVSVAERGSSERTTSNSNVSMRKTTDGVGPSVECSSSSVFRKIDGVGFGMAMAKEKESQGGNNGAGLYMEKVAEKGLERNEKSKERGDDGGKRGRDKDRHKDEKKKWKDKDKLKDTEKEEEKREKADHSNKEHEEQGETTSLIDGLSIKSLPHQNDYGKPAGAYEGIKKRKDFEMNGFLHENDVRSTKFARTPPSNLPLENGRTPSHKFAHSCSINPPATNNIKAERLLDNKEHHINGITEAQHAADPRAVVSLASRESGVSVPPPPHPDSKYLSQVYSVPKMEEWVEHDEQEWLFCSDFLQLRPTAKLGADKLGADKPPEVWAEAIQMELEDVIALPYVIPL